MNVATGLAILGAVVMVGGTLVSLQLLKLDKIPQAMGVLLGCAVMVLLMTDAMPK